MSEQTSPNGLTELEENRAHLAQNEKLHEMLIRSATDGEFRQLMLTDARAAYARFGIELPAGKEIRFVENQHDLTIVLPDPIDGLTALDEREQR